MSWRYTKPVTEEWTLGQLSIRWFESGVDGHVKGYVCRFQGRVFARAETLGEAKEICEQRAREPDDGTLKDSAARDEWYGRLADANRNTFIGDDQQNISLYRGETL